MQKTIRWGILGTGQGAMAMVAALQDVPGAKLVAIASRSHEKAQAFAQHFHIDRYYGSYQELANDSEVDVVYIGTPHAQHCDNALMCLHAGKPVLCEKPFAMNAREAASVMALAKQKNLFVMEAMWTRFLPLFAEAQRIVTSGEIGRVHHVQADFGFAAHVPPEHRLRNSELGGGALLDVGIYPLSIAALFLGSVDSIQATAVMDETQVDAHTVFTLRHRDGGLSSCSCSIRTPTPTDLIVAGEFGYLRFEAPFYRSQSLTVVLIDGRSRVVSRPYIGNGYCHEAIEVGRCLRAGLIESPIMRHDDTLALAAYLDTIRQQIGLRYPADQPG